MSSNHRVVDATPEQVWEVLSDGWLYPLWVVGASRMREVDATWPAAGSHLHHSVGSWPFLLDDSTEVLESEPGAKIVLKARGWPAGEAKVTVVLTPHRPTGTGAGVETVQTDVQTDVEIREQAVSGPGVLVPKPLQDPVLAWRNTEALRRLAYLAERRQQRPR
ncbi:SRPBCC family protein [Nocardioides flavescens]|uniref:SRPBCC family protein n=1 Tax=Nocardioides flavescens TaxID=2691959 RepID=A0A6L7F3H0_9ACTN|nr:SRPBCC family protein [Nocardioides flavescens]MXG91777.1 SRPBCC family protein [Nocardioides flavescens]